MRKILLVLAVMIAGCGTRVTPTSAPVKISGQVTQGGQPISVVLHLQPTVQGGQQAMVNVTDGKFETTVTPGKYTYYLAKGGASGDITIPEDYTAGSMERQVDIAEGTKLDISL
ncbi:MAG: hypothetical protein ACKV0T_07465 [Planctomycetales bacterium]